jgi:ferredoxin
MSMRITDDCISCGACESECPNNAISEGDTIYIIDPTLCVECEGQYDSPRCVDVCPIDDCIVKI